MKDFLKFNTAKLSILGVLLILLIMVWIAMFFIPVGPGCVNCGPNIYEQTRVVLLWILGPILYVGGHTDLGTAMNTLLLIIEILYLYLISCIICTIFYKKPDSKYFS